MPLHQESQDDFFEVQSWFDLQQRCPAHLPS